MHCLSQGAGKYYLIDVHTIEVIIIFAVLIILIIIIPNWGSSLR